jgi:hypothetical protein
MTDVEAPEEKRAMSPLIYRLRALMVRMGDLPDVDADPCGGLSNGAIIERLHELTYGPQASAPDAEAMPEKPNE